MSHSLDIQGGGAGLPAPKLTLIAPGASGAMTDGGVIDVAYQVLVNIAGMPDKYLVDSVYDLGLELVRRKTRARRHNTHNARASVVHSVNIAGGSPAPILMGNLAGVAPNFSGSERPTEWSLVGLAHNATVKIPSEAFTGFFRKLSSTDGVTNAGTFGYLDGRSHANAQSGYVGRFGLSQYNPTGVFWFRYSVWDANTRRRVHGPLSPAIVARSQHSVSTPKWKTGSLVGAAGSSHVFNPTFLNLGPGRLILRIHGNGENLQ